MSRATQTTTSACDAQPMANELTWSARTNCGHSDECYFGSLPHRRNAMLVYATTRAGAGGWALMFNDGSRRQPQVEFHADLEAAKAHARESLSQPLTETGLRALAFNASIEATALCGPYAERSDALAAIELVIGRFPETTTEAVLGFMRLKDAA